MTETRRWRAGARSAREDRVAADRRGQPPAGRRIARRRIRVARTDATAPRYLIVNPTADPQPAVRVRTNDPLSRDITGSVMTQGPSTGVAPGGFRRGGWPAHAPASRRFLSSRSD